MIDEAPPLDFGADPPPQSVGGDIIPFPRMRPSSKLAEAWTAAVAKANVANKSRHQFLKPLDVVGSLMERRNMPAMPWPAGWTEIGRRARTYVGDCVGVVGAIGGGKTSFAIGVGLTVSADGLPVLWCALELDPPQVITRKVGYMHGVHAMVVRDQWPRDRIDHTLAAVHDMWTFVDRYDEVEQQMAAIEDAILLAWLVYRLPPLVVIDHLGELVADARDERHAIMAIARRFRAMAVRTSSFIMLLVQSSVGNQSVLTGRTEPDAASDLIGIETGGKAIASACANTIGLAVYKADDTQQLDARALLSKCRHTGLEGQVGMRFSKPGGVWSELDYLPATPGQEKAAVEADKKEKNRTAPPRTPAQARADINAASAGDAAAGRRVKIGEALRRHGMLGMEMLQIRKIPGVGKGPAVPMALQELERAGSAERLPGNKWRWIARIE